MFGILEVLVCATTAWKLSDPPRSCLSAGCRLLLSSRARADSTSWLQWLPFPAHWVSPRAPWLPLPASALPRTPRAFPYQGVPRPKCCLTFKSLKTIAAFTLLVLGTPSKKNDIIWEFFPTWGGGSSQFPKPKTKKKCP